MSKFLPFICVLIFTVSGYAQSPSKALKLYKKLTEQEGNQNARKHLTTFYDQSGKLQGEYTQLLAKDYLAAKLPDSALHYLNAFKTSGGDGTPFGLAELEEKANANSKQSKELATKAAEKYDNKEFEPAYNLAKQSIELNVAESSPYWTLARLRDVRGDYAKSNALYEEALTKQSNSQQATDMIVLDYGTSLFKQRDNEMSNKVLGKVKSKELLPNAQLLRAKNYLQLRQYKACFQHIGQYLNPSNNLTALQKFDGYYLKGQAYQQRGDEKGAIEAYEAALTHKPDAAEVVGELGTLYYKLGDYEKALSNYSQFEKLTEPSGYTYHKLGNCHFHLGAMAAAEKAYNEAKNLSPNDKNLAFNIGLVAYNKKDFDTALKIWESQLEANPRDPVVQLALCKVYRSQENFEKAEAMMNEALKAFPVIGSLYEEQALLYKAMGKEEEAKAAEANATKNSRNKLALTVK